MQVKCNPCQKTKHPRSRASFSSPPPVPHRTQPPLAHHLSPDPMEKFHQRNHDGGTDRQQNFTDEFSPTKSLLPDGVAVFSDGGTRLRRRYSLYEDFDLPIVVVRWDSFNVLVPLD